MSISDPNKYTPNSNIKTEKMFIGKTPFGGSPKTTLKTSKLTPKQQEQLNKKNRLQKAAKDLANKANENAAKNRKTTYDSALKRTDTVISKDGTRKSRTDEPIPGDITKVQQKRKPFSGGRRTKKRNNKTKKRNNKKSRKSRKRKEDNSTENRL